MKVILTAFGGELKSEVKEWPEPVNEEILLPLPYLREAQLLEARHPEEAAAYPPEMAKGKFKRTGRSFEQPNGSLAYEYALVDLQPLIGSEAIDRKEADRL